MHAHTHRHTHLLCVCVWCVSLRERERESVCVCLSIYQSDGRKGIPPLATERVSTRTRLLRPLKHICALSGGDVAQRNVLGETIDQSNSLPNLFISFCGLLFQSSCFSACCFSVSTSALACDEAIVVQPVGQWRCFQNFSLNK